MLSFKWHHFKQNIILVIHHKNRITTDVEKTVIDFSLINPHQGQAQVSAQLKANCDIEMSPAGVRTIWLREEMNTCALRVTKAKASLEVV